MKKIKLPDKFKVERASELLSYLGLAVLLVILCFPELDLTFTSGIDPSLAWLFNHLFESGTALGRNIIFPHGPLAFVMYPLYNNIEAAVLINAIIKVHLCLNVLFLIRARENNRWIEGFFICVAFLVSLNFNLLLIGLQLSSYLLYLKKGNNYFLAIAFLATVFALYIRVYVAILTSLITLSFLIYHYINYKNQKKIILWCGSIVVLIVFFWVIISDNITGIVRYFYGMFQLSQDNSSAVSYYPDNNWWLLSAFLISITLMPLVPRSKKGVLFSSFTLLAVFAAWKHGMSREDIYHTRNLFLFIFMIYTLYIVYNRKHLLRNIILLTLALFAFEINISSLHGYVTKTYKLPGIANFIDFTLNHSDIKEKAKKISLKNIQSKILPDTMLNIIGNSSIDIYPWEYTYLAANNLSWVPRPVIQSYASYTSWLDRQNALHFESNEAPEFIIWELNKETKDINGGRLESIDNRYLLNDEPNTIYSIFKNYEVVFKSYDLLLYKKSSKEQLGYKKETGSVVGSWNKWIEVPLGNGNIVRAKIEIRDNLLGRLKSFFYKSEECYIYYKLENNEILKYKVIPKNAMDGVWINPFILNPEMDNTELQVTSIQLRSSNKRLMKEEISIVWEEILVIFDSSNGLLGKLFQPESLKRLTTESKEKDTLVVSTSYFESQENWEYNTEKNFISGKNNIITIPPGKFSPVFKLPLESSIFEGCSYNNEKIQVSFSTWIKAPRNGKSVLVFSINNGEKTLQWDPIYVNRFIINEEEMNYIYGKRIFSLHEYAEGSLLKMYILNSDELDLICDDLQVEIRVE